MTSRCFRRNPATGRDGCDELPAAPDVEGTTSDNGAGTGSAGDEAWARAWSPAVRSCKGEAGASVLCGAAGARGAEACRAPPGSAGLARAGRKSLGLVWCGWARIELAANPERTGTVGATTDCGCGAAPAPPTAGRAGASRLAAAETDDVISERAAVFCGIGSPESSADTELIYRSRA
jgi:hypothetical protein